MVPVPEYEQENVHGKEYWNISMGVRKREKDRIAQINDVLERRKDEIARILDEYGIPHVPVVDEKGLSIKKSSATDKDRGDAIPKFE